MALNECKQTSAVTQQPQFLMPIDHRGLLIQNISKHPRLYKNEFLRTPFLHRHEKQQMWDKIAAESGFEKTEDAKCKWRSLINYLRVHLDGVAQKKIRRYIPNTDNPDDKYVQLTDWAYYKDLEFVVPYVKYAASKQSNSAYQLDITPNEIDLIIKGIEEEQDKEVKQEPERDPEKEMEKQKKENNTESKELIETENNDELSEDEEILKEYFENMLKSTLKLPRFHQNRIKQKLLNTINEQKKIK